MRRGFLQLLGVTRCGFTIALCSLALHGAGCAASAAGGPNPASPGSSSRGGGNSGDRRLVTDRPTGDDARALAEAVADIDAGRLGAAAAKLEAVREHAPDNAFVLHELALAYRMMKDPARAIEVLEPYRQSLVPDMLAGLGSALDESGRSKDALALLRDGLLRFPDSGLLHTELGTTLREAGQNAEAVASYERAIAVEPRFAASRYHLAALLSRTPSWGDTLIHGETFRLLERKSTRSSEIARLLVEVCNGAVQIEKTPKGQTAHIVVAPKPGAAGADLPAVNKFEMSFGIPLTLAVVDGLRLESLHRARQMFLGQVRDPKHPFDARSIPLVAWLAALDAAGHLEAYDYWLYGPALPDEFDYWAGKHEAQLQAMARYVADHPLFPDAW